MIDSIKQALGSGLPTVQGVLSEFSKAIAGLENVAQKHSVEATRQRELATAANAAAESSEQEAKQAAAIKAKLAALLA